MSAKTHLFTGGLKFNVLNPEVRYIRVFPNGTDVNPVSYTGGVFFRFGGE